MTRPLRIEFPGALYHVTSRGDRRQTIFADAIDRDCWLEVLRLVRKRFNFVIHAYCQMGNHYHVMLETVLYAISRTCHNTPAGSQNCIMIPPSCACGAARTLATPP